MTYVRFCLMVAAVVVLSSCTRPPDIVGIDNPDEPVAAVVQAQKMKIFMTTTREASHVTGAFFSAERAPELSLTSVTVSIPPNHQTGNVERARKLPPDPTKEFAIIDPVIYDSDAAFVAELNRELAKRAPKDRQILFFVHGYNNTVTDSILRLSQFTADTDFNGVAVLFSWASAAKVSRYVYDLNSALIARRSFLRSARLLVDSNARGLNIFAHSMGAFLTVEAIVQAELYGAYNSQGKVENVMLASPDIDLDLFRAQLQYLPTDKKNFFVFTSRNDRALGFSRRISGGVDRVGGAHADELAGLGVTVIDLSNIEDSAAGSHAKFAGSPEVVALIGNGLQSDHLNTPRRSPSLIEFLDGVPVLRVLTP